MRSPLLSLSEGDRSAVRACVETYGPLVTRLAKRMLPDSSALEDAVQETFIELWRSAHRFDPTKASDRGFVAMIARRRIIDRCRKMQRRPQTVGLSQDTDRGSEEHERTVARIQAGPVTEALERLSPERKRWIRMAVVEGYPHREIAARTGTPLGTIKSGIRRGLAEMRAWLEQKEIGVAE